MLGFITGKNIPLSKDFWELIFKHTPKAYVYKLKLNRRMLVVINNLEQKYSLKHITLYGDLTRLDKMMRPRYIYQIRKSREALYLGQTNMDRIDEYLKLYKTADLQNILYGACKVGNIDLVLKLCGLGAKMNSVALPYACQSDNYELVRTIVQDHKIDPDYGLHDACKIGNIKIVNLLLMNGAHNFDTGFNGACVGGHLNIAKYMAGLGAKDLRYGVEAAFYGGHKHILEYVIERNKDPHVYKICWNMALFGACQSGNLEMAKLAVSYGGKNWNMVWGYACKSGNQQLVDYLLSQVNSDDINDESWNRGLIDACQKGHLAIVKQLLRRTDKNINLLKDCLSYGCQYGQAHIVGFFCKQGAKSCRCKKTIGDHLFAVDHLF